jgi:hypothetical protein
MAPAAMILKAFTHPVRLRILDRITDRPSSPKEMAHDFGIEIGVVAYHARCLERDGLAQVVARRRPESQRHGPLQKFYAANTFEISDEDWMKLPGILREALTIAALRELTSQNLRSPKPGVETSEEVPLDAVPRDLGALVDGSSDRLLRRLVTPLSARTPTTDPKMSSRRHPRNHRARGG